MAVGSRLVAAVVLAGLTSVVAGCGGDEPSDLPSPLPEGSPPAPASPAVSLSPEDARAAQEILAAFDEYMTAYIELSTAGVPGGSEETLARLDQAPISGPAVIQLMDELLTGNYQAGRATAGELTWTAEVVEIDWEFSPPMSPEATFPLVTLHVCFDESSWTIIDKETGEVLDGPRGRYRSEVYARWIDPESDPNLIGREGWYVIERNDGTEPC